MFHGDRKSKSTLMSYFIDYHVHVSATADIRFSYSELNCPLIYPLVGVIFCFLIFLYSPKKAWALFKDRY